MIYKAEVHQENCIGIFDTYFIEADSLGEAEKQAIRCANARFAEEPYVQSASIHIAQIHDPAELETKRAKWDKELNE